MRPRPAARPRRRGERERELVALADRQHGVLARRQLLAAGLGPRAIRHRLEVGRLYPLHREVYGFGRERLTQRGRWLAAVLACGEGAVLSHRSAATLLGFAQYRATEVTAPRGRQRSGIAVHECGIRSDECAVVDAIPVTTAARTLLDLAEVVEENELKRALDEADRLGLLQMPELQRMCGRGYGRRGVKALRLLLEDRLESTRSPLEDLVLALCHEYDLPAPKTNQIVLGREVDAVWPEQKLMVEADSFEFHRHRAAFEDDRARDAAMQVAGFRVVRLTHRRIKTEPAKVAAELRHLLAQGRAAA